jgi:hypothetical protein
MTLVETSSPDLWFDPNAVDDTLVVECWISHGPRAGDSGFDPSPGDWVTLDDGDGEPLRGSVLSRAGDRLTVRLELGNSDSAVAV